MNGMTPAESGSSSVTTSTWPGRSEDLFADDAINKVHEASCGKPRTVNNLAVAALIATCGRQEIVGQSGARSAIREVISAE